MKNKTSSTDNKELETSQNQANQKRRKILKTAGVAGGAAATVKWHKPVLDSVVLPAHAQMSEGDDGGDGMGDGSVTLVGPSAGTNQNAQAMRLNGQDNDNKNMASKLLDTLVPEAHAAVGTNPSAIWRGLVNDVENYQHCVTLTLPAGTTSPTTVDVELEGPTVYYQYSSYNGTYYYYYNNDFSGTAMGVALTDNAGDFEFSTVINGIEVCGSIDSTLMSASGQLIVDTPPISNGNVATSFGSDSDFQAGYAGAFESASNALNGYGAYWSADEGASCSIGTGPNDPVGQA